MTSPPVSLKHLMAAASHVLAAPVEQAQELLAACQQMGAEAVGAAALQVPEFAARRPGDLRQVRGLGA